jgi:hypothetical protein
MTISFALVTEVLSAVTTELTKIEQKLIPPVLSDLGLAMACLSRVQADAASFPTASPAQQASLINDGVNDVIEFLEESGVKLPASLSGSLQSVVLAAYGLLSSVQAINSPVAGSAASEPIDLPGTPGT